MLLSSTEAAERLGVSVRQVQRLLTDGALQAVGPDRVEALSVELHRSRTQGSHRRAWAEATAWAAIAMLEGQQPGWLGQTQRSRQRARLRGLDAVEFAVRARNRAQVHRFRAHSAALHPLRNILAVSRRGDAVAGLTVIDSQVDGYLVRGDLDDVTERYGLEPDIAGTVAIRVTTMPREDVEQLVSGTALVVTGLDLAESMDVRERSAGLALLERALRA